MQQFSSEKKTTGVVTTLSVTVCHSAYWLTIRPLDICIDRSSRAFSVERVKVSGGVGKVSVLEMNMRIAETSTKTTLSPVNWKTYWEQVL